MPQSIARKKPAGKPPQDPKSIAFRTVAGMARCLGFERHTVQLWTADAKFPGGTAGPWDAAAVLRWWRARQSTDADAARKQKAQADTAEHDADLRRMRREKTSGSLVSRDEFEIAVTRHILAAKREMQKIPKDLQTYFPESRRVELTEELTRRIDLALERLANWRPN